MATGTGIDEDNSGRLLIIGEGRSNAGSSGLTTTSLGERSRAHQTHARSNPGTGEISAPWVFGRGGGKEAQRRTSLTGFPQAPTPWMLHLLNLREIRFLKFSTQKKETSRAAVNCVLTYSEKEISKATALSGKEGVGAKKRR